MSIVPADTTVPAPAEVESPTSGPPVTRLEIADAVEAAFATGPATRGELVEHARATGARPSLVEVLEQLPDRQYFQLRQLWVDLSGVPIE